jgi:hypothetical protein
MFADKQTVMVHTFLYNTVRYEAVKKTCFRNFKLFDVSHTFSTVSNYDIVFEKLLLEFFVGFSPFFCLYFFWFPIIRKVIDPESTNPVHTFYLILFAMKL